MRQKLVAAAAILALLSGCKNAENTGGWEPEPYVTIQNADWTKNAVLYQINTRQFTKEGTFNAAQKELPRLKALGVDILWIMPIHPIGKKNRKGTLGSPYSVQDYYGVNSEFGTLADFKAFVKAAHDQDMKVIIDWVANHTAWDNKLAAEHPDYYEKDWKGDFRPTPWWDWSDIIDLDWTKPGVRAHVGGAMEYWVREADIDGFRADVAGYVPIDFWEKIRGRLDKIKPVFMLAEWKSSELHRKAFDATYAWDWHVAAKNIAQGKANATAFYSFYSEGESAWPAEAMRMPYVENHDSNAWEGTQYENFGKALPAITALSFVGEGMPMIHNGQEACNKKRLAFFEKDPVDWAQANGCELTDLLRGLIAFKTENPALWNGKWGARMQKVENDAPEQIFSFVRQKDGNKILGLFNLSPKTVTFKPTSALADGEYQTFGGTAPFAVKSGQPITLAPWQFQLLSQKSNGRK